MPAGRVEQDWAGVAAQLGGDAHGTAQCVARDCGGLARDACREGVGQVATVDGGANAPQDRDAECAAELGSGL